MVLQAGYFVRHVVKGKALSYALPEAKFRGSLPQPVDLVGVVMLDKLVVDHEERVSGNTFRERWELGQAWHAEW